MHISSDSQRKCPSISSNSSNSSPASLSDYDIWRSWEDCLWFQQTLEEEYGRAAREKRRRLAQGKGVKGFNGLYKKDLASSWESLPSGPDPYSVAQDIHKHLPTLTRRGTIFRASQVTIDRRQAELIAFIRALFSDDMPALIKEIRVSSVISDFFGLWGSDVDIAKESETLTTTFPRKSLTNSVFSSYFSASHPSLPSSNTTHNSPSDFSASHLSLPSSDTFPRNSPSKARPFRSTALRPLSLATSSTENLEEPRYPFGSSRRSRSRPLSTSSDSSVRSESSSDTSLSSSSGPTTIADNVPVSFGHNPNDQLNSILEVLPEEQEALPKAPEPYREIKPRPRASATERKARRSYSIFGLSLHKSSPPSERLDDRSVRESWQTADSQDSTANDLLDGLGLVLPHPIKEQKFRASIASISTFMTTDSADAVIPQARQGSAQLCPSTLSTRISKYLSLSDFDVSSDDADGEHSAIRDSVPVDGFPRPISSISESPEVLDDLPLPSSPSSTRTAFNLNCPPSPTCSSPSSSAFSTTTTTTSTLPPADFISIKAIHDTCIILLRVPRQIGFAQVRQRLYNKFVGQEGISLSQSYSIVFVPPPGGGCSVTLDRTEEEEEDGEVMMINLESELDWQRLMSSVVVQDVSNKITLRIQDTIFLKRDLF